MSGLVQIARGRGGGRGAGGRGATSVKSFQLIGAPAWLPTDRYDIDAKAEVGGEMTPAELMAPMQALHPKKTPCALCLASASPFGKRDRRN